MSRETERPRLVRVSVRKGRRLRAPGNSFSAPPACCRRPSPPGRAATILHATPITAGSARSDPCSGRCGVSNRPSTPIWTCSWRRSVDDGAQCADPTHRVRHRRAGRRGRRGARHRQARPHSRADQRRAARSGHLPHRVDLGAPHGARGRHVLLAGAGSPEPRAGTRPALAGEEDRGRHRDGRGDGLLHLLRLGRCDGTLAHHDPGDVRRGARRTGPP